MTALDPRSIVGIMGGAVTGPDSCNVPGPAHGPGDLSLSIRVDRRQGRIIVFSHAGNDWKICKDYVRETLGLDKCDRDSDRSPTFVVINSGIDDDKEKKKASALRIWSQSVNPTGTIVEH